MSVLFVYVGNWAKSSSALSTKSFYKLILASNRDERYSRRVLPVRFWDSPDQHILADQHPDESYGAWLGVSTTGLLGKVLRIKRDVLNISTDEYIERASKRQGDFLVSRASIVPNFLQSRSNTAIKTPKKVADPTVHLSSWEFAQEFCKGAEHKCKLNRFLPFHFFGADLAPKKGTIRVTYMSNKAEQDINHKCLPMDLTPPPGECEFLGYGNSPIYKPFQKVVHGRKEFMDIVTNYMCNEEGLVIADKQNEESIRKELLELLRSTKKYLPDPYILQYARGDRIKEKIANRQSAMFVTDYFDVATRVQTIIFVDTSNRVTYYEWLLKEPIYNPETAEWIETKHNFKIKR